jgi:membrane fusion protein (multidrug efflux system)
MNKRIIRIVAAVAVLLLISYLIADRAGAFDPAVDPEAANAAPKAMTVNALRTEPRLLLDRVAATGSLMAEESIELMVETPGRIVKIGFEEGQNVAQGALLLKIDDEELQAQLRKANHQLKLARTQESRLVKLMKIQAVSQEELDKTITERMAFQADSALLRAQINKTEIRAPFSGTIGLRKVSPGQYVTANSPIAALVKTTPLKLEFSIPEKFLARVRIGQEVRFTTTDGTERKSKIFAIQPEIDRNTRSALVRARYANTDGALVPGFFADVEVVLGERPNALSVPTVAIIPELGKVKLLLAKKGVVTPVEVKTGIRTADEVEIIEGLQVGDTVITSGILQLRPGAPVQLTMSN